jgi:hypothetical protein
MRLQWLSQGPGGVHASCANCGGTVCYWCWGVPEFEQCKTDCEQANAGNPAAISSCVCLNCVKDEVCGGTGTRDRQAYGWLTYSDETCIHQDEVNRVLTANGYNPIARDCKLGPLTCGASRVATDIDSSVGIPDSCFRHQSEWRLPTKVGQAPPPPQTVAKKGSGGALLILASLVGLAAYGYANS